MLDADDIQGHVAVGFGRAFEFLLGLKFIPGQTQTACAALLAATDQITHSRESGAQKAARRTALTMGEPAPLLPKLAQALAISATGLRVLGVDPAKVPDAIFGGGAGIDAVNLGDDVDGSGRPIGWKFGSDDSSDLDVLIIIAAADRPSVEQRADELLQALGGSMAVLYRECGSRTTRDAEHFGFADGISQPGVRGHLPGGEYLTSRNYSATDPNAVFYSKPGQRLTWPGQFIFGYPSLDPNDMLNPGPVAGDQDELLCNGSLLVVRRLTQDVGGFWTAMADLARQISTASGVKWTAEMAGAHCVGRWKDGAGVTVALAGPDDAVSDDPYRKNGFIYTQAIASVTLQDESGQVAFPGAPADPLGAACPFFGHIRKVNPRDHAHDSGSVGVTLRSQMLRRGVPFGPDWTGKEDGQERGLLFMSYQTSIAGQFRKLMTEWVKDPISPLGGGIDPIIGPPGAGGRDLHLTVNGQAVAVNLPGRFVRATGASYMFAPGLRALRKILSAKTKD
ncbi:Dyp-type peroxidase family [Paraburkholderia terricola]|nr:Dyp-type peroxidase family [Paraburkholderia terricola]